jgi:hypothetical protein
MTTPRCWSPKAGRRRRPAGPQRYIGNVHRLARKAVGSPAAAVALGIGRMHKRRDRRRAPDRRRRIHARAQADQRCCLPAKAQVARDHRRRRCQPRNSLGAGPAAIRQLLLFIGSGQESLLGCATSTEALKTRSTSVASDLECRESCCYGGRCVRVRKVLVTRVDGRRGAGSSDRKERPGCPSGAVQVRGAVATRHGWSALCLTVVLVGRAAAFRLGGGFSADACSVRRRPVRRVCVAAPLGGSSVPLTANAEAIYRIGSRR